VTRTIRPDAGAAFALVDDATAGDTIVIGDAALARRHQIATVGNVCVPLALATS